MTSTGILSFYSHGFDAARTAFEVAILGSVSQLSPASSDASTSRKNRALSSDACVVWFACSRYLPSGEALLGVFDALVDPEVAGAKRSPTRASTSANHTDMDLQQQHHELLY
jgi:hypothetical protein